MFIDKVRVELVAGRGGDGVIAWRREKFIPKGGPAGGNGGDGGSIFIESDQELYSLEWFRNRSILKAGSGQPGGNDRRHGSSGKDLVLKVPCGTVVKDAETGEVLYDFAQNKDRWKVCQGGYGGRGNVTFATATNRAPFQATKGTEGKAIRVELELKLIADVGLIGFPNAGKSTLINAVTRLKAVVAPYPFTTLKPNIGYIETDEYGGRILLADIPGIIKGAHANKGLGLEFLRHIERTKMLVFVLDTSGTDGRHPWDDYITLQEEISAYNVEILKKPSIVILNKMDEANAQDLAKEFHKKFGKSKKNLFEISALHHTGLDALLKCIRKCIR